VGSSQEQPDYAIEFLDLSARAEDAIHDAVVEALSDPERRSLLLVQSEHDPDPAGLDWLDPVLPMCATASTPVEAVECLEQHRCDVGIIGSRVRGTQHLEWMEMYPEVCWRIIDRTGRLYPALPRASS
jgi:hypothetical protein